MSIITQLSIKTRAKPGRPIENGHESIADDLEDIAQAIRDGERKGITVFCEWYTEEYEEVFEL